MATQVPDQYNPQAWRAILSDLDRKLDKIAAAVGVYTVSNYTVTRDLDMVTADANDIGNFLCTLVSDLQKARKLGGGT